MNRTLSIVFGGLALAAAACNETEVTGGRQPSASPTTSDANRPADSTKGDTPRPDQLGRYPGDVPSARVPGPRPDRTGDTSPRTAPGR
jgi:hypothetical protein